VVNFLLLPLYTKYLTSFDYGIAGIVYSYVGLLGGLGDLGLSIRFSITFFKYPDSWQNRWPVLTGILFWWSILFSFLQLLVLWVLLPDEMGAAKWTVILLNFASYLLFSSWNTLCTNLLQFKQQSLVVTIVNVCIGVAAVALNYLFLIYLRLGFIGWFYTTFITTCIQGLFSLYWLFVRSRIKIDFFVRARSALKILVITFPLVFHSYASYLLDSSDRVVLTYLKVPVSRIGLYNFAYIFATYFDFITTAVGIASGPLIAKNFYSKLPERYQNNKNLIVFFLLIFLVLAFTIAMLISDFLHMFIRNRDFWNCNYLVCILVFAYCYKPLYWYVNTVLSYNNKTGTLWMMTFTAGVINIILNLVFIPFIGVYACALSTLVCLLFMPVLGSFFRNFKTYNKEHFNFYGWIGVILACGAGAMLLQEQPLWLKLVVLGGFYVVAATYIYRFYIVKIKPIRIPG
jgi:O-antigen/teichoic acid export membrane protein